ncbi:MAG: hypothetical protein ACLT33_07485 [Lachnospira pectinoschiza]
MEELALQRLFRVRLYYADKAAYDEEITAFDNKFDELVRTAYVEKEETAKANDSKQTTEETKEDK